MTALFIVVAVILAGFVLFKSFGGQNSKKDYYVVECYTVYEAGKKHFSLLPNEVAQLEKFDLYERYTRKKRDAQDKGFRRHRRRTNILLHTGLIKSDGFGDSEFIELGMRSREGVFENIEAADRYFEREIEKATRRATFEHRDHTEIVWWFRIVVIGATSKEAAEYVWGETTDVPVLKASPLIVLEKTENDSQSTLLA